MADIYDRLAESFIECCIDYSGEESKKVIERCSAFLRKHPEIFTNPDFMTTFDDNSGAVLGVTHGSDSYSQIRLRAVIRNERAKGVARLLNEGKRWRMPKIEGDEFIGEVLAMPEALELMGNGEGPFSMYGVVETYDVVGEDDQLIIATTPVIATPGLEHLFSPWSAHSKIYEVEVGTLIRRRKPISPMLFEVIKEVTSKP